MFSLFAARRVVARNFASPAVSRPLELSHALSRTFLTTAPVDEPAAKASSTKTTGTRKAAGAKAPAKKSAGTKKAPAEKKAKKPAQPKPVPLTKMKLKASDKPPSRGPTPYGLHLKDVVAKMREDGDAKLDIHHIAAAGRESWRSLSDEQKQVYIERANELKVVQNAKREEYLRAVDPRVLRAFNAQQRAKGGVRIHKPSLDPKPPTPYLRFFQERFRTYELPADVSVGQRVPWAAKKASAEWKEMTQEAKQVYVDAYTAERAEWEKRQSSSG